MAACIYLFGYLPFYSVIYFSMFLLIHPSIYLFVNWERVTRIRNTLVVPTRWPGHPPRENLLYRFMNIFLISLALKRIISPIYIFIYSCFIYACVVFICLSISLSFYLRIYLPVYSLLIYRVTSYLFIYLSMHGRRKSYRKFIRIFFTKRTFN